MINAFGALTLLVGHQEEHPACKNWAMRCWCGCLSGARCKLLHVVQLMPLHPLTSSFLAVFKSRLVLPFWYRLTQVVLEKRPLNGCSCSSSLLINAKTFLKEETDSYAFFIWLKFLKMTTNQPQLTNYWWLLLSGLCQRGNCPKLIIIKMAKQQCVHLCLNVSKETSVDFCTASCVFCAVQMLAIVL